MSPLVSIIIPVYKDWPRLASCLSALSAQSFPRHKFEIIVANNDPSDQIPEDLILPENCRMVAVHKTGSYAARNAALSISRGSIIGFTDSDCIPDKDWITNAVNCLTGDSGIKRIAGNIELFFDGPNLSSAELFEKVYAFKQDHVAEKLNSSVTGNMFTYREVIDKVGIFDEDLYSGGDHEWSKRAHKAGFPVKYGVNVTVKHPARSKMSQLIMKSKRVGGGRATMVKLSKLAALIRLIKGIKPPLEEYLYYFKRYGGDLTFQEKLKVASIKYYLNFVERYEEFRLRFGEQAVRE